jgi:hypothetical protein
MIKEATGQYQVTGAQPGSLNTSMSTEDQQSRELRLAPGCWLLERRF